MNTYNTTYKPHQPVRRLWNFMFRKKPTCFILAFRSADKKFIYALDDVYIWHKLNNKTRIVEGETVRFPI